MADTEAYLEETAASNASGPGFDLNAYLGLLAKASFHVFDMYTDVRLQLAALQVDEDVEEGGFSDMVGCAATKSLFSGKLTCW